MIENLIKIPIDEFIAYILIGPLVALLLLLISFLVDTFTKVYVSDRVVMWLWFVLSGYTAIAFALVIIRIFME